MELKTTELRIGNLIYGVSDRIEEITYITKKFVKTNLLKIDAESQIFEIEHLSPIPLTEEWLLKFGFKDRSGILKNKMSYGIEIGKMEIAWYRQDNKTRFQTIENGFILKYVTYVHELQNLFFALTGEELKLIH